MKFKIFNFCKHDYIAMWWDYSAPRLAQYSTEAHQEIKDYRKTNDSALELSSKNFKSLPLEKLVKIKEIIEGSGDGQ